MISNRDYHEFHESKAELGRGLMEVTICKDCGVDIRRRNASKDFDLCQECYQGRKNEDGGDR